ncbi:hypothetical protein Spb1_37980 [Planctopirus ephydatiae]|uniref:Uncharacterized protein n=1 Tax=Planctopirus ephydatiae TaxID=2528019 RepID=A0A518GTE3_9PLAN|nr:hypothetical protein [Planctopirus ephydatiae]QDV31852.1 hypothetical protein Spb1_37980 [Planctopirus ephydatiae]
MSIERHKIVPDSSTVPTATGAACDERGCRTGICSPCVIVWGLVVVWLIASALWETLQ